MNEAALVAREYFGPALSSVLISLGFGYLSLISGLPSSTSAFGGLREAGMALVLACIGLAGTTAFYTLLFRNREFEARLVLAAVFGPTVGIVVVVLSQAIVLSVARGTNALAVALIILISLYMSVFSAIFIIADWVSGVTRNMIYVIYGSILGSFIGVGLSSPTLLIVLLIIAVYDLFMGWSGMFKNVVANLSNASAKRKLAYRSKRLETGVGDFIFNSCLPAHVCAYFPIQVLMPTVALMLAGYLINFRIVLKRGFVGGISVPTFLGVIPALVSLALRVH